jgi:hypothetical protein
MISAPTAYVVSLALAAVAGEDCQLYQYEIPLDRATDLN